MTEDVARFWDERYRQGEPLGKAPAALLVENAHLLPAGGKALDAAMGTGRNALYLAQRGFQVTGIDVSAMAMARCRAEARRRGLLVQAIQADLSSYKLPREEYDLIVNFYYLDRGLAPRLVAALKPGALLFFETFTVEQLAFGWGPQNRDYLLQPGELRALFPSLEALLYREGVVESERGPKAVASLIGRKGRTQNQM